MNTSNGLKSTSYILHPTNEKKKLVKNEKLKEKTVGGPNLEDRVYIET
jgi:hypothetical protein